MGARPLKLVLAKELRPSEAFVKASAVYSVTCLEGSLGMMLEESVRSTNKSNAAGLHSLLPRLRRGLGSPTFCTETVAGAHGVRGTLIPAPFGDGAASQVMHGRKYVQVSSVDENGQIGRSSVRVGDLLLMIVRPIPDRPWHRRARARPPADAKD